MSQVSPGNFVSPLILDSFMKINLEYGRKKTRKVRKFVLKMTFFSFYAR